MHYHAVDHFKDNFINEQKGTTQVHSRKYIVDTLKLVYLNLKLLHIYSFHIWKFKLQKGRIKEKEKKWKQE